jgi:catechol 2,3-dioxygenase-like lactoylglutathione lyase family enzyme
VRLGFYLEAEATATETFAKLRAAGADIVDESPEEVGEGTFTFRVRDPDGNVLDVVGR